MSRNLRIAGYVFLGLTLGLAVVVGALWVLTETEYGQERVRRVAVSRLQERVEGEVRVERIESDGLLGGVVLYDVAIVDTAGRPFLRAESARLRYGWSSLLRGRFVFDRVEITNPEVTIERLPGDTLWNFERVFPDTTPDDEDNLILIDRVTIGNGLFVVRFPWEPDDPVTEPEDTARLILRSAPGGLVRELRFENVDAELPRVLWESPVEEGRYFRIAELSTRGYIWKDPFELVDLEGEVTLRDSLISFDIDRFQLPDSYGSGVGRIITEDGTTYDIRIDGERVAFADIQWLYPALPAEGRGELVFRIQSQPDGTLWFAQDAHIVAPGTEVRGEFGIVTGETVYFTRVNLRASPIDLEMVAEVLPGDLSVEGLMVGTVVVEGPISSLSTRADLRLVRADGAPAHLRFTGTLDLRPPYGVTNLDATLSDLDLARLPVLRQRLPLEGTVSGRLRATGRLDRSLRFAADIRHRLADGPPSELHGTGTFTYADGRSALDATMRAEPVALELLAAAFPRAADRLRGEVRGPVRVHGALSDLVLEGDLNTAAGRLVVDGRFDLAADPPRYDLEGRFEAFRVDRIVGGLPETELSGAFDLAGAGEEVDAAATRLSIDLDAGRIGPVALSRGLARAELRDGLVRIDSLVVVGDAGRLRAAGAIGVAESATGTLDVALQLDSLGALRLAEESVVAVEDSAGAPLGGAVFVRAVLDGSVRNLTAEGTARFDDVRNGAFEVGRANVRFTASGVGTESPALSVRADASGAAIHDRPLDSAFGQLEYTDGSGRIELEARAADPVVAEYRLVSDFERVGAGIEFDLREVVARDWLGDWQLVERARVFASRSGLTFGELAFERADSAAGRIHATGHIPWGGDVATGTTALTAATQASGAMAATKAIEAPPRPGQADFRLEFDRLPLAPPAGDPGAPVSSALLSGTVTITGRVRAPLMNAELALDDVRYDEVRLDRVDIRLSYANRAVEGRLEARYADEVVLTGMGRVPVDLTLAAVPERRLAEPLDAQFDADGVPVAFLTGLVDGFRDVRGELTGTLDLAGTTLDPVLAGDVRLRGGALTWGASNVRYSDIEGTFRVLADEIVAVGLEARSGDGSATALGTLTFTTLTDPRLSLTLEAREFPLAARRDVEAVGTGTLRLEGRYTAPRLSGSLRIDRGTLYLDEVWHQYNVVALDELDPFLFDGIDTTLVSIRRTSTSSPFLRNLVVQDFTMDVGRDTWLRGRALNVEVAGQLQVDVDRRAEELRLTGTLNAIRGAYELFLYENLPVRRFTVREGTVEFSGMPGINPRLNIIAAHRVRSAGGTGPLDVEAVVTGTLGNPRVSLRSDADPPIPESDLMSLLMFGRPSTDIGRLVPDGDGQQNRFDQFAGLAAPALTTLVTSGLQPLMSGVFDYFAITESEAFDPDLASEEFYERSQVEVGRYFGDNLYLGVTGRKRPDEPRFKFGGGARLEWVFAPTWTAELFWEDRFIRANVTDLDNSLAENDVWGFFFFREWGY